ncbi:MAG: S1 RNA-binding domain-containing protein [Clostridium sp.]|nr:MAG: S1 RNA-binding domain-containing protein [Clostridium sp.]
MNSNSERKAIDCERDVDNMLMTWYMSKHIDEHYDGIVVSILSFGMFVMLENGVEGLVSLRNMDDYFTYDEAHQKLISASRTFSLGDKVRVVVIDAVRETSKIDLMLEEDYGDDSYGEYLYK